MSLGPDVTFFTICNEPYFLGTVALLNSLRLTGHGSPLVILDVGLHPAQRTRLQAHATVVDLPLDPSSHPVVFKAFPHFFEPEGVVVIIDSDMMVTRSLAQAVDLAAQGRICVFPDHASQAERRFEAWVSAFDLRRPLRRLTYVNSGFIALSADHWPDLLPRFWQLCERIPRGAVMRGDTGNPFWTGDQDALNALLMSEIDQDALELLPASLEVYIDGLKATKIVDPATLTCRSGTTRPAILHYSMAPKAWTRKAWLRVRKDAYVRLFPRVACRGDVALRLDPKELPLWLRPGVRGWCALAAIDAAHGALEAILDLLPQRVTAWCRRALRKLAGSPRR